MAEEPARPGDRTAAPRRSVLAITAFVVGLLPTGCGQLVAPVLALMAWLEIRSSRRPMRGAGLAAAGLALSLAWMGVFVWLAQWAVQDQQQQQVQRQVERDQHAAGCVERLQRVASGWTEARAADQWTVEQLREDEILEWLVEQEYVAPEDLCCPAAAAGVQGDGTPPVTVRFMKPLPPDVLAPDRCIVLFEDRARHRKERGRGRHVLYADGHVDWLVSGEFGDAIESQQKAAADAARM